MHRAEPWGWQPGEAEGIRELVLVGTGLWATQDQVTQGACRQSQVTEDWGCHHGPEMGSSALGKWLQPWWDQSNEGRMKLNPPLGPRSVAPG